MNIVLAIAAISQLALTPASGGVPANRLPAELPGYRLVSSTQAPADPTAWENLTPEQKMQSRWPQPVKAGFLIGLPLLDYNDSTIGHVRRVVRTGDGKILLIVAYGGWLTWTKRLVPVPIETVAILARQINLLDIDSSDLEKGPAWSDSAGQDIAGDATIQIGISRR
jgi:hypothetical protein